MTSVSKDTLPRPRVLDRLARLRRNISSPELTSGREDKMESC